MPGTDLGDRLDHLLRTVEDGVIAGDPAAVTAAGAAAGDCAAPAPPRPSRPSSPGPY